MKKTLALLLAVILLSSLACAFAEKKSLTLWSIAVESDSNAAAYNTAVREFNASGDEYELVMETTENEAYKTKLKAAMAAGEGLPDVFFAWTMGFLGDFVEAGRVYCLDDVLPEYKDEPADVMLGNTTYNGGLYGVPLSMNVVTLFANMDLLRQVGWEKAPETYEELIGCCDSLVAAGIIPFSMAGKENRRLSEYIEPLLVKTIGAQGLRDCYTGASSWNQEGVIRTMTIFREMVDKGYFDPAAALGNEEVKQRFIGGKTAFYQNGSWNCGELSAAGDNFIAIPFPVIGAGKSTLYEMVGESNNTPAVSALSELPEVSARIAFDLGRTIAREGNLNGASLPAWTVNYDTSSVNRLSRMVADMVAQSQGMVLFGDNFLNAEQAEIYLNYIALLFADEIDPQGFAEGLAAELQ